MLSTTRAPGVNRAEPTAVHADECARVDTLARQAFGKP